MKDLVIWKANWILFDFVFWYNIDFVICSSLKSMCIVVGFYLILIFFKEKTLFWGLVDPKKKVLVLLFILKFFRGCQSSIKIKYLFQGSCRLSKFLFQGSQDGSLREGMIMLQWLLSTGWVFCTGSNNEGQRAKDGQRAKRTGLKAISNHAWVIVSQNGIFKDRSFLWDTVLVQLNYVMTWGERKWYVLFIYLMTLKTFYWSNFLLTTSTCSMFKLGHSVIT